MTRHILALTLATAALAACTSSPSSTGDDDGSGSGSGSGVTSSSASSPKFLSFGTNVQTLTEGQEVVFSAVLTDPDGINDLIGGTLQSPDGKITYGAFTTSDDEGAYSLALSWGDLQEAQDISFKTSATRAFTAVFFDAEGNTVNQQVTLQLTCGGRLACSGNCQTGVDCGVTAYTEQSCDAACAALAMSCDSSESYVGDANYESTNVEIATCSAAVPSTYNSLVFDSETCTCIPNN